MSAMDLWREPTIEEAEVVSQQAKKEAVIAVSVSLLMFVMICPLLFFISYEELYVLKRFEQIPALLIFAAFAALMVWTIVSEIRHLIRVRKQDYTVVAGVSGGKSSTGYRHKKYYIQVNLFEGHCYRSETSWQTYRKVENGSKIIITYHQKRRFSRSGMWAYLNS